MKTKIIYISGSEIFNITDIRAAFEEVRSALQLDSDTVLFGVPVDQEDAGFGTTTTDTTENVLETSEEQSVIESVETVVEETPVEPEPKTKRVRARKTTKNKDPKTDTENDNTETITEPNEISEPKVVPILSVLSGDEPVIETEQEQSETDEIVENTSDETEIVVTETEETEDIITEIDEHPETENEGEPDLEKLLSAMTPLQEDTLDEDITEVDSDNSESDDNVSDDVDATLEQLATEFAETQDKIAAETKSSGRSKIGKLRNILPFKQSKHKDQGLGDLFGWAGVAANDEDFSVPGFFTNASSKK